MSHRILLVHSPLRSLIERGDIHSMRTFSSVSSVLPRLNIVRLDPLPIFHQLVLEERLLRETDENWCLFNTGPAPSTHDSYSRGSIVLGLSGDPHQLVHVHNTHADNIPLIKRYSGGGTVYVDNGCRMVSLILSRSSLPHVQSFPRPIMEWSGVLYRNAFQPHLGEAFQLKDNDYVFGSHKVAGNAQSITRDRWCHVSESTIRSIW